VERNILSILSKLRYAVFLALGLSLLLPTQVNAKELESNSLATYNKTPSFSNNTPPAPNKPCKKKGKVVDRDTFKLVCVKRTKGLRWVKVTQPSPAAPLQKDIVTAKIESLFATLPSADLSVEPPSISFLIEDSSDEVFIPGLTTQFLHLAQAYPEFSWEKQGVTIMPKTETWLVETMKSLQCHDTIINYAVKGIRKGSFVWGVGATACSPDLGPVAVIARSSAFDNNAVYSDLGILYTNRNWVSIVASEFGEVIRSKNFAQNSLPPLTGNVPMSYFNVNMPSWMREGSELAFFSIAQFKQTRSWYFHKSHPPERCGSSVLKDYASFTSESSGCHYVLGQFALELMLALYGPDAPTKWFRSFGSQTDAYVAFKTAYGDDYEVFEGFVSEFINYRLDSTPMSLELTNRLS
jgi:hypothetical protein